MRVLVCLLSYALTALGAAAGPVPLHETNASIEEAPDLMPVVVSDGAKTVIIAWQSAGEEGDLIGTDLDLIYIRSIDAGETWSQPAVLNTIAFTDKGSDFQPSLAADGKGQWVASWISRDSLGGRIGTDTDPLAAYSTDHGRTWIDPFPIEPNADAHNTKGGDFATQIAFGGKSWIVAYEGFSNFGPDADPLGYRSSNGGLSWPKMVMPKTTSWTDTANDTSPKLVGWNDGQWLAVWTSDDALNGRIGDLDILFARSADDGETWTPAAALNVNSQSDTGDDRFPAVASDGWGGIMAVWESNSAGAGIGDFKIVFARSEDSGMTWSDPLPIHAAGTEGVNERFPKLAMGSKGEAITVWESHMQDEGGLNIQIRAATSTDGGATWREPLIPKAEGLEISSVQMNPSVAVVNGAWIVAYERISNEGGRKVVVLRTVDDGKTWALHEADDAPPEP